MAHLIGSGAPIESETGVGFMLRDEFDVPPLSFTYEQLEALALGAKTLALIADKDLSDAAREALEKKYATLCLIATRRNWMPRT